MSNEDLVAKIAELEKEIQDMKDSGDEEMVELMMMELEEMKERLNC